MEIGYKYIKNNINNLSVDHLMCLIEKQNIYYKYNNKFLRLSYDAYFFMKRRNTSYTIYYIEK